MSKFSLDYEVFEHGWAQVSIRLEDQLIEQRVSYLHDSLTDLAYMAMDLDNGVSNLKAKFKDEPGRLDLVVSCIGSEVSIEVYKFPDDSSNSNMQVVAKGKSETKRVRHQIFQILHSIYTEIGPEIYKEHWKNHEFPTSLYLKLKNKKQDTS